MVIFFIWSKLYSKVHILPEEFVELIPFRYFKKYLIKLLYARHRIVLTRIAKQVLFTRAVLSWPLSITETIICLLKWILFTVMMLQHVMLHPDSISMLLMLFDSLHGHFLGNLDFHSLLQRQLSRLFVSHQLISWSQSTAEHGRIVLRTRNDLGRTKVLTPILCKLSMSNFFTRGKYKVCAYFSSHIPDY